MEVWNGGTHDVETGRCLGRLLIMVGTIVAKYLGGQHHRAENRLPMSLSLGHLGRGNHEHHNGTIQTSKKTDRDHVINSRIHNQGGPINPVSP